MGKPTGFMEYKRENPRARPVAERVKDYRDIYPLLSERKLQNQAARCMDCGIPFCQSSGCPVVNLIPEFNDLVYRGQWRDALEVLHLTNNFPEFTGRVCPAPCEPACVSAIHNNAVSIKQIELQIIEKGFEQETQIPNIEIRDKFEIQMAECSKPRFFCFEFGFFLIWICLGFRA